MMPDTDTLRSAEQTAARATAQADAAARQAGRAASETARPLDRPSAIQPLRDGSLRDGAEAGADLARQGVQAGAEAMRHGAETASETARRGARAMAEGQRQLLHDAAQTFEETSRKVAETARSTGEDVRRLFVLPNAAEGGLRDTQQAMAGLVEGVVQTNLHFAQELFRLADPAPVVELQQRFMREYLDALTQGTATLMRAMRRTADETLRPLEEQAERRRREQHHQDAAE